MNFDKKQHAVIRWLGLDPASVLDIDLPSHTGDTMALITVRTTGTEPNRWSHVQRGDGSVTWFVQVWGHVLAWVLGEEPGLRPWGNDVPTLLR